MTPPRSLSCGAPCLAQQRLVDPVAEAMQRQQVHFLDARGTVARRAQVDIELVQQRGDLAAPLPVSATTLVSRWRAAWMAAITFAELPEVESASRMSPGWPSASTCLENTTVKS